MGKSILISIQPQWVCKILNGEKTIEVRKKFPKDYVGWVYIYCTKAKPNLWLPYEFDFFPLDEASKPYLSDEPIIDLDTKLNGKVVARFWCDKVEKINVYDIFGVNAYRTEEMCVLDLVSKSRLTQADFERYLGNKNGYAIHISKLEVFDKPKQLDYYGHKNCKTCIANNGCSQVKKIVDRCGGLPLEKAPQSWCYVEEE